MKTWDYFYVFALRHGGALWNFILFFKKRIKRDEEDFEDLIEEIGKTEELEDEEDDELMSSTLIPAEVVSILNSKEPRGPSGS